MNARERYPSVLQAIGLLLLASVVSGVAGAALGALTKLTPRHPLILAGANLAGIGLVLAWGARKIGVPWREVFPLAPIPAALFPPIALAALGMSILVSEIDDLFRSVVPMPQWLAQFFLDVLGGRISLWASVFAAVLVAPATEELLFRGLILRGFLKNYGFRNGLLLSAVLFGLFHLNPWQFFGATLVGLLFGWWVIRTRSLLPSLFGHALLNGLPTIISAIPAPAIRGYTGEFTGPVQFQPLWFNLLGAALVTTGIALLICGFRRAGYAPLRAAEPSAAEPSAGPPEKSH